MNNLIQLSVYGGALLSLILPFYDFDCHCFFPVEASEFAGNKQGQRLINTISLAQRSYFAEHERFTWEMDDLGLGLGIAAETEKYRYRILQPMIPVQSSDYTRTKKTTDDSVFIMAQSNAPSLPDYLAAVFAIVDDDNQINTKHQICQINFDNYPLSELPRIVNNQIICPQGTIAIIR